MRDDYTLKIDKGNRPQFPYKMRLIPPNLGKGKKRETIGFSNQIIGGHNGPLIKYFLRNKLGYKLI